MDISNSETQETSNYTTIIDPDESFMTSFKAAAAAVTELYTKGANQRRQAFQNGYQKCLEDLMNFVNAHQQQRSQGDGADGNNNITITSVELWNWARTKNHEIQNSVQTNLFCNENGQFTFCFQPNATMMYNHPNQREIDNIDTGQEGGIGTLMGNDSLKRRLNEQHFMGRPMTDTFFEPSFKRGRSRKEE
ncbi:1264_t:CDS:2 [Ambispora gerdemannii]|uniref:1264_t:CDS:1 n=1 Tax=Ambispora gerdemannii TaxID=144530 RepID=A0A9N9BGL9_9GLOM|nr:1264_t:CDS:2 [Ambispora gerdemannii]